ncbi:MAG: DUF2235 domain-containing protein [Allosphingosinicella sp.]
MAQQDPKSLVLFSDGTGNSSAQLFKTNVWRMYEAVDLGPGPPDKRDQISYYDDGVGTSGFRPLAILGGAFGWGLKRNVLDIYRYACRNYREGDQLFGFGFSRGAFTMRLVIALIGSQGLVTSTSESELDRKSKLAYRAFRTAFLPRRLQWPTKLYRAARDGLGRAIDRVRGRKPYDPDDNRRPEIRFVGVWDTVSAYGGPIAEITRAIDNWIFPLSMPDYELSNQVRCARHALALDDERDAFHPLLWDEVREQEMFDRGEIEADRLQQVWFTGMHADVGGGYPDESLSYVSLLWMMEEAENAGLRTLKVIKDRFVALANSYGPLHDSRSGAGAYYRYQPRKITTWLDPVDDRTLSLRDPIIRDSHRKPKGLLRSVAVHESVVARLAYGTDRYAPMTLPECFRIVPPQARGENVPQADSEGAKPAPSPKASVPLVDPELRARIEDPDVCRARAAAIEKVWDLVWWRRVNYFATLFLTLLLATMPLWADKVGAPPLLSDGRTWIGGVIRIVGLALPAFLESWVDTYADNAFYFLVLAIAIAVLLVIGGRLERRMRDQGRNIWRRAVAGVAPPAPGPSPLQRIRNGRLYQRCIQVLKWTVLPNFVVAPLMILFLLWLVAGLYTQARLPGLEKGKALCPPVDSQVPNLESAQLDFSTRSVCHNVGAQVVEGEHYVVTFEVVEPWRDGSRKTNPTGLAAADLPWGFGYAGVPFRRVVNASYLQPTIQIRPAKRRFQLFNDVHIYPLEVTQQGESGTTYRAEFEAGETGQLSIFANDAVLPFTRPSRYNVRYFYELSGSRRGELGNGGTACVTIQRSDLVGDPVATSTPVCQKAAEEAERRDAEAAKIAERRALGKRSGAVPPGAGPPKPKL